MLFEKYIMPQMMTDSYRSVTPGLLSGMGIRLLICDIDNTLVTYDDPKPTEELSEWFRSLKDAGISVAFVSNNHEERVSLFNCELGYTAFAAAHKPGTRYILEAMKKHGEPRESTALLGDQLLTDAVAANRAGIYCIIVPPIKDKKSLFFKAKRLIERPYIKKFKKMEC